MSLSSFPLILCPKQVLLKNISTEPQVQSKSWTIRVEYYCNSCSPAHHQYWLHFRKANAGAATICFCCTLIWRSGHLSGVHGAAEWFRGPAPKNTEMGSTVCSCQWISNSSKIRDGGTLCCKKGCKWLRKGQFGVTRPTQNTRLQWRCMLVAGQELDSFNTQEILNVSGTSSRRSTTFLKFFLGRWLKASIARRD